MKIVQLTPGTGSFYCGTCLRDNALVVELRRQGHDALLTPLYLPPTLDEAAANPDMPIFYGGVNVYLQQRSALFRKSPRWLDRYLDAPGVLRLAARGAGMTSARELGEITVSTLKGEEGNQVKELDRLAEWLATEVRPEAICLSNVLLIGLARRLRERTGAAMFCTLQGEAPFLDSLPEPARSQSWGEIAERATDCDGFFAVSRYYAELMKERARLPDERVHVVYNGINLDGYAPAEGPPTPVLGYLSRMCEGKGLGLLVAAYVSLRRSGRVPGLRLHIGGSCTATDEPYVESLKARLRAEGLESDASFFPNLDRAGKIEFLRGLTALSVPAPYGESFGLYLVEAWAAGVPVVQPDESAFGELLRLTGGGILYPPGDPVAYADALADVCGDARRARELGLKGRAAVEAQFSIEQMARQCARVFERGRHHGGPRG